MQRVSRGDREAFATVVELHSPALEGFAIRLLAQQSLAQEVVQETWIRAWQKASHYNAGRSRLTTWLHQITHNLCVDLLRRQQHEKRYATASCPSESLVRSVEQDVVHQEAQAELTRAMAALSERQRTALILTYYQALPNRDVAEIMDLSVRAVESLLVRARQQLKTTLEESL